MHPLRFRDAPKRETLRVRRRRVRAILLLALAAFFALAAYGVSALSYLPRFSVDHIEVSGANDIRGELVRAYVATKLWDGSLSFLSKSNIFLYPRAEIETALKEFFPRVERAKISRQTLLGNAITVSIEERKPFGKWCPSTSLGASPESCYTMDGGGFIFAFASTTPRFDTMYEFEGSLSSTSPSLGQTYLPGRFSGVLALLERLGQAGFSPQRISAESSPTQGGDQDFSVALAEGFRLRVSFGADVGAIVKNLELVLSSETLRGREDELEYVDLRFGNRVYYKLKGEEQHSVE